MQIIVNGGSFKLSQSGALYLSLTYCDTDFGTGHSQTDIIGQGHINAEHSRVVKELTKNHLAFWRGCHSTANSLHRCGTVGFRDHCAHLIWQAGKRMSFDLLNYTT